MIRPAVWPRPSTTAFVASVVEMATTSICVREDRSNWSSACSMPMVKSHFVVSAFAFWSTWWPWKS